MLAAVATGVPARDWLIFYGNRARQGALPVGQLTLMDVALTPPRAAEGRAVAMDDMMDPGMHGSTAGFVPLVLLGVACTVVDSLDGFAGPPLAENGGSSGVAGSGSTAGTGAADAAPSPCIDNPDCDDGNPCTEDVCWANQCLYSPLTGQSCDDGDVCNGQEVCDSEGQCAPGTPLDVDDENSCTVDYCDPKLGARHEPGVYPPLNVCIAASSECPNEYYAASVLLCDAKCGACPFCVNGIKCEKPCEKTVTACCGNQENCPTACPKGYKVIQTLKAIQCGCGVEGPAVVCERI